MAIAVQKTAAETAYLEGFAAGNDWLAAERQKGFDAFAATGLPHRRMEDWKWTDLRQLINVDLSAEALKRSTVALRMSARYRYLVALERLTIEAVGETAVSGSFEGKARRGSKAKTWLPIKVSFVALKAVLPAKGR